MELTITTMTKAHIPALAALEQACFSTPWSEAALSEELGNPLAIFLVAERKGIAVGYAGMQVVGDEGFFTNVAVSPACRRQGIADALLAALVQIGKDRGFYRLTLEVRVSNAPAISLYEKYGFVKDGIRPRFYRDPAEDAAIYSLYYQKED